MFAEGASVYCRKGSATKGISRVLALHEVDVEAWDGARVRDGVSVPGGSTTLCILRVNGGWIRRHCWIGYASQGGGSVKGICGVKEGLE